MKPSRYRRRSSVSGGSTSGWTNPNGPTHSPDLCLIAALIRAISSLDNLKFSDDRQYGINIIRRAAEEPLRQIAVNAGVDGSIVIEKVKGGKGAFGFNAATEEYEDLVKAGVIDPTKVVRAALQNAASVASLMLTTEALVAERPKKKSAAAGGGHGAPGGMGGGMGGDDDF